MPHNNTRTIHRCPSDFSLFPLALQSLSLYRSTTGLQFWHHYNQNRASVISQRVVKLKLLGMFLNPFDGRKLNQHSWTWANFFRFFKFLMISSTYEQQWYKNITFNQRLEKNRFATWLLVHFCKLYSVLNLANP